MNIIMMILLSAGLSLIIAASWCGQRMDGDIASAPYSKTMRFLIHYGSGLTAILGFIYFILSFFIFGWWALLVSLTSLIIQYIPLKIAFVYEEYLPLICIIYIMLANILCLFSLFSA